MPKRTLAVTLGATLLIGLLGFGGGAAASDDWMALASWGGSGTGNGKFSQPMAITVDASGDVWTAENGGGAIKRLQRFDGHGNHLASYLVNETNPPYIIHALDADNRGNVWVGNAGVGSLERINSSGAPTGEAYGTFGSADDNFDPGCPCGVAVDTKNGLLYGSNGPDGRILVWDLDTGDFVEDFDSGAAHAGDLAVDTKTGTLWVVDQLGGDVLGFPSGSGAPIVIEDVGAEGVDVDGNGNVYLVTANGVSVFDADGELLSSSDDPISNPVDVATDGFGNVYVLQGNAMDAGSQQVERFMYVGAAPKCKGQSPTLLGTLGDDSGTTKLVGTSDDDVIAGLAGDDRIEAGAGRDVVCGGDGNDEIYGEGGGDWIKGERGNDFIDGGDGKDKLLGSGGADELFGGAKPDVLKGQGGNDLLDGGAGSDTGNGGGGTDECRSIETATSCES